jgi:hypothetical protein
MALTAIIFICPETERKHDHGDQEEEQEQEDGEEVLKGTRWSAEITVAFEFSRRQRAFRLDRLDASPADFHFVALRTHLRRNGPKSLSYPFALDAV